MLFTNRKCPSLLLAAALTFIALLTACGTKESMESMKRKAESGDAQAQFDLAMIYYEGEGSPSDDIEAMKRFLGLNYALAGESVGKNYVKAAKWFRKAAEQGNAEAQYYFGLMCNKSEGMPENYIEKVMRTRKAAEQEESKSQFHLGLSYAEGAGVRKDNIEAVMGARKTAEQGYAYAQYNLGWMYFSGEGVTKDAVEAYAWFLLAKSRGYERADRFIETLEERLMSKQRAEGQAKAAELDRMIPRE